MSLEVCFTVAGCRYLFCCSLFCPLMDPCLGTLQSKVLVCRQTPCLGGGGSKSLLPPVWELCPWPQNPLCSSDYVCGAVIYSTVTFNLGKAPVYRCAFKVTFELAFPTVVLCASLLLGELATHWSSKLLPCTIACVQFVCVSCQRTVECVRLPPSDWYIKYGPKFKSNGLFVLSEAQPNLHGYFWSYKLAKITKCYTHNSQLSSDWKLQRLEFLTMAACIDSCADTLDPVSRGCGILIGPNYSQLNLTVCISHTHFPREVLASIALHIMV